MALTAPPATRPADAPTGRDELIDVVRAAALGVVVVYHWCFTVVRWHEDGPHASNPIGSTPGLWLATWGLQVMPLFFVVGGAVHARATDRGVGFVIRRLRHLLPPAAALALVVGGAGWLAGQAGVTWAPQAALLVCSPLWFLAVYAVLVVLTPLARRAHGRWGELVPVVLAVTAAGIDLARFRFDSSLASWAAWVVVFGFCHQLGFFWPRLRAAPARFGTCLATAGLGGLVVLTNMGLYPRSAVGVPGERLSNMGPPTLVIVALCCLQLGLLIRFAPMVLAAADGWAARPLGFLRRHGMPLYLIHGSALAIAYAAVTVVAGRPPTEPDLGWWLTRPLWLILPGALCLAVLRRRARTDRPEG